MKGRLYHLVYNIHTSTLAFYRDLFAYLEYRVIDSGDDFLGVSDGTSDIWLLPVRPSREGERLDRDGPGLNHIAIRLESRENVDRFFSEHMLPRGIAALFETPRDRPEFRPGGLYYQVLFEDPEGLMVEVLYVE